MVDIETDDALIGLLNDLSHHLKPLKTQLGLSFRECLRGFLKKQGLAWDPHLYAALPPQPNDDAYYLALRYAVRTEQYDRTLPHVLHKGVADVRPEYRAASNKNARRELDALHRLSLAAGIDAESSRRASEQVARLGYEDQVNELGHMPENLRKLCNDIEKGDPK
jgi:hypothetical protein